MAEAYQLDETAEAYRKADEEALVKEQLNVIRASYLPGKCYIRWKIRDSGLDKFAERNFFTTGEEYKRLLESRKDYISRMIRKGDLLRYGDHICVVKGAVVLDFLLEQEDETKRSDIFAGEVSFHELKLTYQGSSGLEKLRPTLRQDKPHEITFSNILVDNWDFLRKLFSEK